VRPRRPVGEGQELRHLRAARSVAGDARRDFRSAKLVDVAGSQWPPLPGWQHAHDGFRCRGAGQPHQPLHDARTRRRDFDRHAAGRRPRPETAGVPETRRRDGARHRRAGHAAPTGGCGVMTSLDARDAASPRAHRVARIVALDVRDVRFPTSRGKIGSDAMNHDPDYSAVYITLRTDDASGLAGHALVFTIGRGNEVQAAAVRTLSQLVVGRAAEAVLDDLGGFARALTSDSHLRWLGPEKGVMHMAIGGVVNAAWDLAARRAGLPERGYPAYTTSPGWLGYADDKLEALARQAVADGFRTIKLKVGENLGDDIRRLAIARAAVGEDIEIAIDANQRWDVAPAIEWIRELAPFRPAWVEEPTSPDDVLGHAAIRAAVAPVPVSTGEHTHNRVMFKQLLQARAVDLLHIDAARVGGVNENLAILLLAAKFGLRVFPHA